MEEKKGGGEKREGINLSRLSMVLIEGDSYNLYHKRREITKEKDKINLLVSF